MSTHREGGDKEGNTFVVPILSSPCPLSTVCLLMKTFKDMKPEDRKLHTVNPLYSVAELPRRFAFHAEDVVET